MQPNEHVCMQLTSMFSSLLYIRQRASSSSLIVEAPLALKFKHAMLDLSCGVQYRSAASQTDTACALDCCVYFIN